MFKTIFFTVSIIAVSNQLWSQPFDQMGLESGLVINKYFPKEKVSIKNNHPLNCYLKLEYNGRTCSHGKWHVFIPMGIMYSYYTIDYNLNAPGTNPNLSSGNSYHDILVFVGPQLQYHHKNTRVGAALFLNHRYVSSRVFGLYHLNQKWWIGPSFELFFYDVLYSIDEFKNRKNIPNYKNDNFFGLNGNAVRFNAGIKLQMDLKN